VGHQSRQPPALQGGLGLVEGGPRQTECRRAAADRLPVDAHPPHHLVLDLHEIAGVEEVGRGEERILDTFGARVEAALLSQRFDLGIRGSGLGHGRFRGGTSDVYY